MVLPPWRCQQWCLDVYWPSGKWVVQRNYWWICMPLLVVLRPKVRIWTKNPKKDMYFKVYVIPRNEDTVIVCSPSRWWKVKGSFVVRETFLEHRSKTELRRSRWQLKSMETRFGKHLNFSCSKKKSSSCWDAPEISHKLQKFTQLSPGVSVS